MAGKGDKPRPVDKGKYDKNFNEIFGPNKTLQKKKKTKNLTREK